MVYEGLESSNGTGIQGLFSYPNISNPEFYPALLFGLFVIFTSLSFYKQMEREGKASILSSLAVSGYVTTAIAFILTLLNLIDTITVVIVLVVSLVFQALFLLTNKTP